MSYAGRHVPADRARRSERPGRLSCSGLVASLEEGARDRRFRCTRVEGVACLGMRGICGGGTARRWWGALVAGSAATVLSVPGDCRAGRRHPGRRHGNDSRRGQEVAQTRPRFQGDRDHRNPDELLWRRGLRRRRHANELPPITVPMTIEGSMAASQSTAMSCGSLGSWHYNQGSRLFYVASGGSLTLQNLQIDSSSILGAEAGARVDGAGVTRSRGGHLRRRCPEARKRADVRELG